MRRMRWVLRAARAAAAITSLAAPAAAELPEVSAHGPWVLTGERDAPGAGYRMYEREVPGSDFAAYRLEATIDAPPRAVAAAAQRNLSDPDVAQKYTTKTVLRDDPDATVVYSYIDIPIVSDRDVVTHTVRSFDPDTGSHRLEWRASEEGPAPRPGVVRLRESRGSWEFAPLPDGRTRAVYESHTDIGGSIPAWLLERLMSDTVVDGYESLRVRVERDRRAVSAFPERSSRAR